MARRRRPCSACGAPCLGRVCRRCYVKYPGGRRCINCGALTHGRRCVTHAQIARYGRATLALVPLVDDPERVQQRLIAEALVALKTSGAIYRNGKIVGYRPGFGPVQDKAIA